MPRAKIFLRKVKHGRLRLGGYFPLPDAMHTLIKSRGVASFIVAAMALSPLYVDIAPTRFVGGSLVPVAESEVSLDDAEVNIEWGTPCKLDAMFTLNNASAAAKTIEIGFPVGAYHPGDRREDDDDESTAPTRLESVASSVIAVEINGHPVDVYRKIPDRTSVPLHFRYDSKTTWYYYSGVLSKGVNSIKLRTTLTPSGVYCLGLRRVIAYCIWTGGRWKGPIGHEHVAIHFPCAVDDSTIYRFTPLSGRVSGNSLVWDFVAIEPKKGEYDIEAEFLVPSVATRLAEMRKAYDQTPHSREAMWRYARHLLALGHVKGNGGYPPWSLSRAEFENVLVQTKDRDEQQTLRRYYREEPGGSMRPVTSEWTAEGTKVVRIFADAGFVEHYPGLDSVNKARAILEDWLTLNPKDAEVWRFYLSNSGRFFFAGQGNMWGMAMWGREQKAAVRRASESCPEDPVVASWHKSMLAVSSVDLGEIGKLEGESGKYKFEFESDWLP